MLGPLSKNGHQHIYIYIYILISKKDVYSKGYFMNEKHKASKNLQRRKKQRNKQKKKKKDN